MWTWTMRTTALALLPRSTVAGTQADQEAGMEAKGLGEGGGGDSLSQGRLNAPPAVPCMFVRAWDMFGCIVLR